MFYNAVFKYENFKTDLNFLSEALNLPSNLGEQLDQEKLKSADEDTERRRKYFNQLSDEQMTALMSVYSRDFEMFEYSPEGYGNM